MNEMQGVVLFIGVFLFWQLWLWILVKTLKERSELRLKK
mgnify:CR=1 FL=1